MQQNEHLYGTTQCRVDGRVRFSFEVPEAMPVVGPIFLHREQIPAMPGMDSSRSLTSGAASLERSWRNLPPPNRSARESCSGSCHRAALLRAGRRSCAGLRRVRRSRTLLRGSVPEALRRVHRASGSGRREHGRESRCTPGSRLSCSASTPTAGGRRRRSPQAMLDIGDAIGNLGRASSSAFGVDDLDRVAAAPHEGRNQPGPDRIFDGCQSLPE